MNGITKSKSTKLLSALLAVLMIVAMLPTTAFASTVPILKNRCTSAAIGLQTKSLGKGGE